MEENVNQSNGSIWNHPEYGYGVPSIGERANENSFENFLLDPTGMVKGFWNDITGVTAQSREFAQQEYLQDKMNAYNSPVEQMKRAKEAGINPNLAAAGIAQAGSQSAQAPSVSSNSSGAAQGLSAVGSAVSGVAGAALTAAQKRNLDASSQEMSANARRTDALLDFEKEQMRANTAKTWIDAGMDSAQADYWSTKAAYADRQERLDIAGKFWQVKRSMKEVDLLKEEINIAKKDLEIRKEQLSQEEYRTEQMRIDTEFYKRKEEILKKYGIDISLPENAMLVEAWEYGTADTILAAFQSNAYHSARAQFDADLDTLEDRLTKQIESQFKVLEKNQELAKELQKFGVKSDAVATIIQTILKYLFGTGFSVNIRGVGVSNNEPTR